MLDRIGSCLSAACAVHCALKPLLLILPSVAWLEFVLTQQFENYMFLAGVVLAGGSVSWGLYSHGRKAVFMSLALAVSLVLTGKLKIATGWVRTVIVVAGGFLIAATHLLNDRFHQRYAE